MFEIMPMTVSNEAIPYVVMSSPLLLVAMVKWNNYIQGSYYHNFLQSQDLGICKVSTPSLAFFASLFTASFFVCFSLELSLSLPFLSLPSFLYLFVRLRSSTAFICSFVRLIVFVLLYFFFSFCILHLWLSSWNGNKTIFIFFSWSPQTGGTAHLSCLFWPLYQP